MAFLFSFIYFFYKTYIQWNKTFFSNSVSLTIIKAKSEKKKSNNFKSGLNFFYFLYTKPILSQIIGYITLNITCITNK